MTRRSLRSSRAPRCGVAVLLVAATVTSLLGVGGIGIVPDAHAADDAGSSVTVKWAGGNDDDLQRYQPDRSQYRDAAGNDTGLGVWDAFKNLSITVDRTADLTDGAVKVSYTGAPPGGLGPQSSFNLMQCWGEDPLAPDFAETCQWGGWTNTDPETTKKREDLIGSAASQTHRPKLAFRSADGRKGFDKEAIANDRAAYFVGATSNEVAGAVVGADGSGFAGFEVQSAAAAPQLGCGALRADGTPRPCWLVAIPREGNLSWAASPVEQVNADVRQRVWDARMTVPLGFRPLSPSCAKNVPSAGLSGTQLLASASSSWQAALCRSANPTAFALSTVSEPLVRSQLLKGTAAFAAVPRAATAEEFVDDPGLTDADIVYAPLAVTAPVVAVDFQTPTGIVTRVDLSPRLMAKLLTQSFPHQISGVISDSRDGDARWWKHLSWVTGESPVTPLAAFWDDPDVRADFHFDDPNSPANAAYRPALPLPQLVGPAGSDSIRQLWQWIQADDKARAFLQGKPDERGMTINPYYLPKGHPDAVVSPVFCYDGIPVRSDGRPCTNGTEVVKPNGQPTSRPVGLDVDLATGVVDTFPKADETRTPIFPGRARTDAQAYPQYAESFEQAARRMLRGDTANLTFWDAQATPPAYKPSSFAVRGKTFMIGVIDAPTAAHWSLPAARLRLPNQPTVSAAPDDAGMGAALASQRATSVDGVTEIDMKALKPGAYPLTQIVYGALNLNNDRLSNGDRGTYAKLVRYAVTDGQKRGHATGELPVGYFPLTEHLRTQALDAAARIEAGPRPKPTEEAPDGPLAPGSADTAATGAENVAAAPAPQTATAVTAATSAELTGSAVGSVGLGGALVAGLAGMVAAPFLLRRRRM